MNRRAVVAAAGASLVSLAGCVSVGGQRTTREKTTARDTDSDGSSLTDWEATTDCDGDPDHMYDSVIEVAQVETSIEDSYAPIHFSDLTPEEQAVVRPVTDAGGYGTCDPGDAFHRLVDRVADHTEQQSDATRVYLERDGVYYALYVEVQDQVYAY